MAKLRQRGVKCQGERACNINRKRGLFHLRYFENGPLEPGYKMSACKIALTSSKYKQSAEMFAHLSKHFQFSLF